MKFSKPRDPNREHLDWLGLVDVSGPFLSLPVLRKTWPSLDALTKQDRERLRSRHSTWQSSGDRAAWIDYVLHDLLGWGDALRTEDLGKYEVAVPEHDITLVPDFTMNGRLLGLICEGDPVKRIPGSEWAATPADRVAHLCRAHDVPLGLATDGRRWALVWAPRQSVTTTAVFDAMAWNEAAELVVVRAFVSLLGRERFLGVTEDETLPALLAASKDNQEVITERLGSQVRQAVELLVAAIGRADAADRDRGGPGLGRDVTPHDVYRGAVTVMMRVVFLLFAEERGLLPADNDLYLRAYSAGRLCEELEQRANAGSETELEHTYAAWHRLLALCNAVYRGVDHPKLTMHAHDGSLFDPDLYAWLPLSVDDRTVLHMLRAVQYVWISAGKQRTNRSMNVPDFESRDKSKKGERRKLSFRTLDVEQIGYVYEGLLSYEGLRTTDVVVGLVGAEGLEEEVRLRNLARLSSSDLAEKYKESGIGSVSAVEKALAPMGPVETEEARSKLLAVTKGDAELTERLLPFYGVIRADLRGQPTVILPGALYVTESSLRKNTGTHYTPRDLAQQVAEGALEPLVYRVGPLQTADRSQWVPKTAEEILDLKVADIAMGSAAFLVAAARYLGDRLVEAWSRAGDERAAVYVSGTADRALEADEDPVVIEARRQVIEHCLYGVDVNPMAVEMAKLSLWLVSMDPRRPFTFLDDRLVAGDSLLGITSVEQLEYMHLDPRRGRKLYKDVAVDFTKDVRSLLGDVAERRRALTSIEVDEDDPLGALARKRSILGQIELDTAQVRSFADLLVGASLAHAVEQGRLTADHPVPGHGDRARGFDAASLKASALASASVRHDPESMLKERVQRKEWLETDRVTGYFDRHPIHWPLTFPEVFDGKRLNGPGFDAIIGNPPFLGGSKISGSSGPAYREHLVTAIARGAKGNGDLVAYFLLRAHALLNGAGQTGLIATNTLAQGDTREVGLDRLIAAGVTIRQSVKSKPWPSSSAVLEYCVVWSSCAALGEAATRMADEVEVSGITPSLDPESRVVGNPHRLVASSGIAIFGTYVLGMGFTMEPEKVSALIRQDERNRGILFPYLNGQDLNSRPDCSASRWIINFKDWPESEAKKYPHCYEQVVKLVKPERAQNANKQVRERWWQYKRPTVDLYRAIASLERVIVITLVSKVVMPVMVPTGQVFAHKLGVFATDDTAMLAMLSSAPHYWWTRARSSTMKADINYSPSDVFETLPLPELTQEMRDLGARLDTYRRDLMLSRQAGLTTTYNMVNNPANTDDDIAELRRIHVAIDEAVCRAYGWTDLLDKLAHGHHPVARETRFTVGPAVQRELVDRLLELNRARYAEEVKAGLHDKPGKKAPRPKAANKPAKAEPEGRLF
ncbi:Eco57I restriction-modification methylase domain-containing protein [Nonomuraea sp. CA-143628]|uniref:Eco57I restriction-modification methylase domain-containing protein n=1 Tax=Nonomuraea sp. CA-143628 TaxID=3239997 RepID=UPI003D8E2887